LSIEAYSRLAGRADISQETSNVGHNALERVSFHSCTAKTDEAFDIQDRESAKTLWIRFIVDIGQQRGGRTAVSGDGAWRQAADLIQMRRVRRDSLLDPAQRSGGVQGGFGFEIAIQQAH
jgi:hypothetical protein